jgi:hypothetical protein
MVLPQERRQMTLEKNTVTSDLDTAMKHTKLSTTKVMVLRGFTILIVVMKVKLFQMAFSLGVGDPALTRS